MKKKRATMPPRVEWDFGEVPAEQYTHATLYEYARESEPLRISLCAWLQTQIEGESRADKLIQALKKGDEVAHTLIAWRDLSGLEATLGSGQLLRAITKCPNFPAPFLNFVRSMQKNWPTKKRQFNRVKIDPLPEVIKQIRALKKPTGVSDLDFLVEMPFAYRLQIRWDQMTVNDIKMDFAKWLSGEAKNHPELKARGKRGQFQHGPLKWLAALRIEKAGFTCEQARKSIDPTNKLWIDPTKKHLPLFGYSSDWIVAIEKARKLLRNLEAGKDIVRL